MFFRLWQTETYHAMPISQCPSNLKSVVFYIFVHSCLHLSSLSSCIRSTYPNHLRTRVSTLAASSFITPYYGNVLRECPLIPDIFHPLLRWYSSQTINMKFIQCSFLLLTHPTSLSRIAPLKLLQPHRYDTFFTVLSKVLHFITPFCVITSYCL